ncbi:hypothetical protein GOODEAATRI_016434 [Goodea atripinnis]|uniref:CULT domain-containing protein n=1 Tax=Goodea atripinnis TaxID=208336 RepID=A0ABV0MSK6_9TELE
MRSTSLRLLGLQWDKLLFDCIFVLLLFQPSESCAAEPPEHGTSTDTLILCRACGHEVAFGTDIHFVPSRMALSSRNDTSVGGRRIHVQLFENPHGHQFEVITFRRADVIKHWPADRHFSWYPGFSWTVATCPRCKTHLALSAQALAVSCRLLPTGPRGLNVGQQTVHSRDNVSHRAWMYAGHSGSQDRVLLTAAMMQ